SVKLLGKGFAWLDTGTYDDLLEAAKYIATMENRPGLKIDREKIKETLTKHSSSNFLVKMGGGIETGKTGTNVNDIRILGVVD
ncbi:MAG: hypothetical protein P8Z50_03260, partial [candidate division WOR-3 bacterium]